MKYLLLFFLVPFVSASISNGNIEIEKLCLNQISNINFNPLDEQNNSIILDNIQINSTLNFSKGNIYFEDNHFVQEVNFTEKGNGNLKIVLIKENSYFFYDSNISVIKCPSGRMYKAFNNLENFLKENQKLVSSIILILFILVFLTIVIKISKT